MGNLRSLAVTCNRSRIYASRVFFVTAALTLMNLLFYHHMPPRREDANSIARANDWEEYVTGAASMREGTCLT